MNKLKTKLLAHKVITGVMSLAVVVSLAGVVFAYSSEKSPKVVVEGNYIEAQEVLPPVSDVQDLGAVSSPFLNGPEFGIGKDWQFSVNADLVDATTTFVFAVPFRKATSTAADVVVETLATGYGLTVPTTTVELVRINFTSSTPSAYVVDCGSSSNQFATSTSAQTSQDILESGSIAAARGNVTVENDLQAAQGADVDGGAFEKIMIGPSQPYIVCKITTAAAGEWTGADGVSPGKMVIRFSRVQ